MGVAEHIAIYLPSLCGGGAERIMVTLANAFAERGFQTDLVLVKAEGPYLNHVFFNSACGRSWCLTHGYEPAGVGALFSEGTPRRNAICTE